MGAGAGMREIEGLPNVLRALVLDRESARDASLREVAVLSFDVDDMTGEEIAVSADRLRAAPGVLDLTIGMRLGKKGRPVHDFRLLARIEAVEAVAARCLTETSTLGLRWRVESREVLPRSEGVTPTPAGDVRVKRAVRPDGEISAKAEDDDVGGDTFAARRRLRHLVESRSDRTEPHSR